MNSITFNAGVSMPQTLNQSSKVMTNNLNQKCTPSFGNKLEISREASKAAESMGRALVENSGKVLAGMTALATGTKLLDSTTEQANTSELTAKQTNTTELTPEQQKQLAKDLGLETLVSELAGNIQNDTLSGKVATEAFNTIKNVFESRSGIDSNSDRTVGFVTIYHSDWDDKIWLDNNYSSGQAEKFKEYLAEATKIPGISRLFQFVNTAGNLDLSNCNPEDLAGITTADNINFPDGAVLSLRHVYHCDLSKVDPKSYEGITEATNTKFANGAFLPSLENVYHCDLSNVHPQGVKNVREIDDDSYRDLWYKASRMPDNANMESLEIIRGWGFDLSNVDPESLDWHWLELDNNVKLPPSIMDEMYAERADENGWDD